MPDLIAIVIAYNEERMLPGCLQSVQDVVDRMVVVDGAYQHFPHPDGRFESTDSTPAIAGCYGAEFVRCPDGGWPTQVKKRTACLLGNEGDWYLHIDADERLKGNMPPLAELPQGCSYRMSVVWAEGAFKPWAVRLFQHQGRMEYRGAHCALFSGDRLITRRQDATPLRTAWFLHLKTARTAARQRDKIRYYAWQKRAERKFRERWRV
jgi:hypothetical protein